MTILHFFIVLGFNLYWALDWEAFKDMYSFKVSVWFSIFIWFFAFWGLVNLVFYFITL